MLQEKWDQVLEEIRLQESSASHHDDRSWDKHLISQYLLAGCNDYIVKPFNLDEMLSSVTGAAEKSRLSGTGSSSVAKSCPLGNLVLNPGNLWTGLANRAALGQEFQIFETLLASKKIFTKKEELYEAVWKSLSAWNSTSILNWAISERKLPSLIQMRTILNGLGLGCSLERRQVMWVLVLILVVLVPFLGLVCFRLLSAQRICRSVKKRNSKRSGNFWLTSSSQN